MSGLRVGAVTVVTTALLLTGCGGAEQELSAAAATALDGQMAQVRAAVTARDPAAAHDELSHLRDMVERLHGQREVGDDRARLILDRVADVQAQLVLLPLPEPSADPGEEEDRREPADDPVLDDPILDDPVDVDELQDEVERKVEERLREAEKQMEEAERRGGRGGGRGND